MKTEQFEQILNSINSIEQAEMPPFFETRLKATMQNKVAYRNNWYYVKKPVVVSITLLVMLIINVYLLSKSSSDKNISKAESTEKNSIESINNDYQLFTNSTY